MRPTLALILIAAAIATTGCGDREIPPLAPQHLTSQTLFVSGDGEYLYYRIPSLLVTRSGTVLAFAEGRRHSRRDHGDIDIVLRRSADGGHTWSPMTVVGDMGPDTCGNPTTVQDRDTGTIWLLMSWNLATDTEAAVVRGESQDTRRVFVSRSDDDGCTWSEPREITAEVKTPEMRWYGTGPGRGIQLSQGPHRGRLIIPGDHSYQAPRGELHGIPAAFGSHVFYSDDHGKSWCLGGVIRPNVGEPQVVELTAGPGDLLANLRAFTGHNRRAQATSGDGGLTWTEPRDQRALIEPVCQASILRYSWPEESTDDLILFSNPASRRRENLVVRASRDGGRSWPQARAIHLGPAAYSCLARMPGGKVGCLYEAGTDSPYEGIVLTTFPLAALAEQLPR